MRTSESNHWLQCGGREPRTEATVIFQRRDDDALGTVVQERMLQDLELLGVTKIS